MVLITDRNEANSVFFPKNIPNTKLPEDTVIEVLLAGELNQKKVSEELEDLQPDSNMVYEFDLTSLIDGIPDGEYRYTMTGVRDEGESIDLGCGLLRIGNLKYNPKKNNNSAKTVIQYGE